MVKEFQFRPFVVGLFLSRQKPTPFEDFLHDFTKELRLLVKNGITYNGQLIEIVIHSFVCDAPARAAIKCIKGHSGYYSCERCSVKGYYIDGSVSLICDGTETARTDSEFSRNVYVGRDDENYVLHQTSRSPLATYVPCASSFVLDAMHLVFLGVVKRMLEFWKKGPDVCRISARQIETV